MTAKDFITELGVKLPGNVICDPINCGAGLEIENEDGLSSEDSYMVVSESVSASEYRAFLKELKGTGRKELFHREYNGNTFAQFENTHGTVYTYYTGSLNTARVILDRVSTPTPQFEYRVEETRDDTLLMQFALKYGQMIRHTSCDCGMMYAIRLRDNSLVLFDGGESEQATEEACDELIERLYGMTEQDRSERLRISLWVCTHNHNDHMDVFSKLLRRNRDNIILERVMFNFPSESLMPTNNDCTVRLKSRLKEFYPDVKLLKPHTGQIINIPGAQFEILTTHEDILPESYRTRNGSPYRGMNESTTIYKVWVDNVNIIFLGDAEETNGEALLALYGDRVLFCEFLQAAHHLINDDRNIYSAIHAKKLLIPQCRFIGNKHQKNNTNYLTSLFGTENMYYAGDCTYIFKINEESITYDTFEQKGYFYDNSEL